MRYFAWLFVMLAAPTSFAAAPQPVPFAFPGTRWIGVQVDSMTPELREAFGAPRDQGVLITAFEEGSPALRAGLKVGDVIVRVGTQPVHAGGDLYREIGERKLGDTLLVEAMRDRKMARYEMKVEENPCWKERGQAMTKTLESWRSGTDVALKRIEERLDRLEHEVAKLRAQAKKE